MNAVVVDIKISPDEYIKQYQSPGCVVSTRARDGRTVRFPAHILKKYLMHSGISGSFRIEFHSNGKFKSIVRLR